MALFRRRRRDDDDTVGRRVLVTDDLGYDEEYDEEYDDALVDDQGDDRAPEVPPEPTFDRARTGPFDRDEVSDEVGDRVDLGSLWLGSIGGCQLRIEVDQQSGDIQSVTTDLSGSSMQVQAFAAPRSGGLWRAIRTEIADSITERGGAVDEVTGPFGLELLTRLPSRGPDGRTVYQVMRFIGVDGPRWFLRAVVTGPAASEERDIVPFYDMIGNTVVLRGSDARPPREMLPLRLPKELTEPSEPDSAGSGPLRVDDLKPFERGPEISEIR
ncbi:hypothetical protein KEM60_02367 [Austwickia sp. TVS 96-490-7B]|uniref:DUF3710 domain-containing protein n=1 Tax=Austwickia sp. TVS 96-490-7B TaxID=2830843 RepID=UPI001C578C34|nr:DUF3710 domain-containing protein [Austwickia sp. TVS 96-490-7B]MBW3086156.1 hypothetical protein [Austwickia sp. TVS 96-490-7B]